VVVDTGATVARDLLIPNRNLEGVHFAMEFLHKNTKSRGQPLGLKDKALLNRGG